IPFTSSSATSATAMISLHGPGSATDEQQIQLEQGETKNNDFRLMLPEPGTHTYVLNTTSNGEVINSTFTLDVLGKPDLALAENDFKVQPAKPVVGHSVFITTTIFNVGEGPATNVAISAYDGDP